MLQLCTYKKKLRRIGSREAMLLVQPRRCKRSDVTWTSVMLLMHPAGAAGDLMSLGLQFHHEILPTSATNNSGLTVIAGIIAGWAPALTLDNRR